MTAAIITMLIVCVGMIILIPLLIFAAYQSSRKRIGYIPLPDRAIPAVISALELKGGIFFELGCGDGRIIAAALDADPKLASIGIEYNPLVVLLARWRLRRYMKRTAIIKNDYMKEDLSTADYIFTYLSDPQLATLEPKLDQELRKGARLVACDFPLAKRQPNQTVKIGDKWQLGQTLYIYEY